MSGHWRHSGARIYWAQRDRGNIVQPLLERLVIEIKDSIADPKYARRPHHVNSVRLRAGLAMIETVLTYQDMYAVQNLAILAYEYRLDTTERSTMISLFNDRNVDDEQFARRVLQGILDDEKLKLSVQEGRISRIGYSTLFPKDAEIGSRRCEDTFIAYRKCALRRQVMRREMRINSAEKISALAIRQEQVLRVFDRTMGLIEQPDTYDDFKQVG